VWYTRTMVESIILLLVAGAAGALVKDILEDNCIKLPKFTEGKLNLGFLGALIIGAAAGYTIDGSFFTAAMGGFVGKSIIENLVIKNQKNADISIKHD